MICFHIGRGGWVLGWEVGGCTKWWEGGGGEGAIGEEGAPVVVFLQPSPCPLNLLGLVDDLSPPSAWPSNCKSFLTVSICIKPQCSVKRSFFSFRQHQKRTQIQLINIGNVTGKNIG